jgi:hypothetical protein
MSLLSKNIKSGFIDSDLNEKTGDVRVVLTEDGCNVVTKNASSREEAKKLIEEWKSGSYRMLLE